MNQRINIFLTFFFLATTLLAQKKQTPFQHVEPPFWWVGMKNTSLQVLFYNKDINISAYTASLNYPGVELKGVERVSNEHYLFFKP